MLYVADSYNQRIAQFQRLRRIGGVRRIDEAHHVPAHCKPSFPASLRRSRARSFSRSRRRLRLPRARAVRHRAHGAQPHAGRARASSRSRRRPVCACSAIRRTTRIPGRSLWNRDLPGITYQPYTSSTTRADLKQPTGSSRLCLSCHDGFVAMGNLRQAANERAAEARRADGPDGARHGPERRSSRCRSSTTARSLRSIRGIVDPGQPAAHAAARQQGRAAVHDLPQRTREQAREVPAHGQCRRCHVRSHAISRAGWMLSSHAISPATWKGCGVNPFPADGGATVAANGCSNCHRIHSRRTR